MMAMEKTSFDQLLMDVFREMGAHRPEQVFPGWSLSLEKSSVSRLVQQLEQQGWVARERDARDGRLRLLRLTEAGAATTDRLRQLLSAAHATLFERLTPHEQAALLEGLSALRRALQDPEWKQHGALDGQAPHRR